VSVVLVVVLVVLILNLDSIIVVCGMMTVAAVLVFVVAIL